MSDRLGRILGASPVPSNDSIVNVPLAGRVLTKNVVSGELPELIKWNNQVQATPRCFVVFG